MDNSDNIYEAAKEILEKLLDFMDIDADVNVSHEFTTTDDEGVATSVGLNIEGEDLGILIGRRGQTMSSLQHIVRLIISHQQDVRLPVVVDVEGYKERRCEGLRAMANRLAEQVSSRKAPFTMEPMSAFERRIIHVALVDNPDVFTESTGMGESRKVVIAPKTIQAY